VLQTFARWAAVLLTCSGTLVSQSAKEVPAQPNQTIQGPAEAPSTSSSPAASPQSTAASVLCFPEKKAATRVEVEPVTNTGANADLSQYLSDSVVPLIRANWFRLVSRSKENAGGDAAVDFTLLKDGAITDVKLTDGAGHAALGELAVNAVLKSGPFPAQPAGISAQVTLRGHFSYESASSNSASAGGERPISARICSADEIAKTAADCMVPPKVVSSPEPEFSAEARKAGAQGTVLVWAVVASSGSVQSACVNQLLGHGLDEQAVNAVRAWKFEPATFNRAPAAAQLAVEVDFHLYEKPPGTTPGGSQAAGGVAFAISNPTPESAKEPSDRIESVGHGVTPPKVIFSPLPEAPSSAKTAKDQGTATIQLIVTPEGKVDNLKVLKSLGPDLDQKALDAVRQWTFHPATKDGKPVAVQIVVEIKFSLY
jgi:TonB family protein